MIRITNIIFGKHLVSIAYNGRVLGEEALNRKFNRITNLKN